MASPAQDKINWLTAPAVPVEVIQMINRGQQPAGRIINGPMGQQTYIGALTAREVPDNSWRDGLKHANADT